MDWKARVELFEQLRQEHEFGIGTIAGVAAKFGVHRRMVRQAIAGALPPVHRYPTVLHGSAVQTHDAFSLRSHAVRTYCGRPRSSMRFSALTAMATSVARRRSVWECKPSPITRLKRLTSASTSARQL